MSAEEKWKRRYFRVLGFARRLVRELGRFSPESAEVAERKLAAVAGVLKGGEDRGAAAGGGVGAALFYQQGGEKLEERNDQAFAIEIGGIDEARRKAEELADLLDKAGKLARDISESEVCIRTRSSRT